MCFSLRREYPPLSMLELQRMIDLGLIDPNEPIDLSMICNTKRKTLKPLERHYGFNLTDEVNFNVENVHCRHSNSLVFPDHLGNPWAPL